MKKNIAIDMSELSPAPVIPVGDWRKLLPLLDQDQRRLAALLLSDVRLAEIDRSKPSQWLLDNNGLPTGMVIPHAPHSKEMQDRYVDFYPPVAVILASCMPTGDSMLPDSSHKIMLQIMDKAEANGIKLGQDFILRANESYLERLAHPATESRSHSERIGRGVFRVQKPLRECAEFARILPDDVPADHRQWALTWVADQVRRIQGGPLPDTAPVGLSAGSPNRPASSDCVQPADSSAPAIEGAGQTHLAETASESPSTP